MPAKAGAPTEVPPTAAKLIPSLARKPAVQLVRAGVLPPKKLWEHIKKPSWFGEALSETSGTSREASLGTPVPTCQLGLENTELLPPPVAERLPPAAIDWVVSFQPVSGM
jgi:hypothetical protein